MRIRYLFLAMVISIAFTGGYFTGAVSGNNDSYKTKKIAHSAQSAKNPVQKTIPNLKAEPSKVLIGYVQDFRDPAIIDYEKLTHVIFSFAHPGKDGSVIMNDAAINNLRAIILNAQKYDTKVILAIGGWFHIQGGESYDYFRTAIADTNSRSRLVKELLHIVDREKLDGIDIDFEHPRNQEDAQSLAAFAKELSEQLHPIGKELSIAVNAKVHSGTGTEIHSVVFESSMFRYVDYVNIMAYDGHWDDGYNAANLSPFSYTENIVAYWTSLFESLNLSKEKLVLGVPFYAQPEDPAIKQVSYAALIEENPENAGRDTAKMNGTTYHYNGDETMQRKTKLALDHGLGGMMIWEAGHDAEGPYSLAGTILEVITKLEGEVAL